MRLKYYLRGLGIGMIVTALLMGFATKDKGEMSDAEIKARAAELGMVEQRTLADIRDNAVDTEDITDTEESESLKETDTESESEAASTKDEAEKEEEIEQLTVSGNDEDVETVESEPEESEPEETEPIEIDGGEVEPGSGEDTEEDGMKSQDKPATSLLSEDVVQIEIYWGNNSISVSEALEEAGLVEDAAAFDKYLRENGLSKIINMGTYKIKLGTSEEEIAKIITNTH